MFETIISRIVVKKIFVDFGKSVTTVDVSNVPNYGFLYAQKEFHTKSTYEQLSRRFYEWQQYSESHS